MSKMTSSENVPEVQAARHDVARSGLAADFANLLKGTIVPFDFTLTCRGTEFKCHKLILATRSSVFRDTLADVDQDAMEVDVSEPGIEFIKM